MSRGHCLFSHGFGSGPNAVKVKRLATVAHQCGWTCECVDYTDLDARLDVSRVGDVSARLARLNARVKQSLSAERVVLAGSSLGAYISGHASLLTPVSGVFLMAPPIAMGPLPSMDVAPVPFVIIHGWHDAVVAAADVIAWAKARAAPLWMLDDSHHLDRHIDHIADLFAAFLTHRCSPSGSGANA